MPNEITDSPRNKNWLREKVAIAMPTNINNKPVTFKGELRYLTIGYVLFRLTELNIQNYSTFILLLQKQRNL